MPSLICPVCSSALKQSENLKNFQCEHLHLFDLAKQGYINLLLSHRKKSKQPGDTNEMVIARREFLNRNHYERVVNEFEILANKYCSKASDIAYADLGCGEGYYTERLHRLFSQNSNAVTTCGIDISTPAIKSACKRDKSIRWVVASASHIPLASASQDLASCLFFRFDAHEVARTLKTDAILISANTGPEHLIELREHLYDDVKTEKVETSFTDNDRLDHLCTKNIKHQIELNSHTEIEQLLSMTPHYWRAKPEKKQALSSLEYLKVSLDIRFDIYRRTSAL